jgi:AbrB family looped-hinge helix DNA binding protein
MTVTVDERGRILIPKELRDAHGLSPGSPVIIEPTEHGIELRPALPKEEAMRRLRGVIPRTAGKGPGAFDAKRIWEPKI